MNQLFVNAIRAKQSITFEYLKEGETTPTVRILEPVIYGIKESGGNELLGGMDGSTFKMFKVKGISNANVLLTESVVTPNVPARSTEWSAIYAER